MNPESSGLSLLGAMITPAVLISACGTLIFSTSTRLARVIDRVRHLSAQAQRLVADADARHADEQVQQFEIQLGYYARRSRLVQGALTSFYVSLGLFVASTVSIGLAALIPHVSWVPSTLGVVGTLVLFAGCVLLISETRLAMISLEHEMESAVQLFDRTLRRRPDPQGGLSQGQIRARSTTLEADPRWRDVDGPEGSGALYVVAGLTALLGLILWIAIALLAKVDAAWESPHFYQAGVPALAAISALAGFLRPRWSALWGITTLGFVPMALLFASVTHRVPLRGSDLALLAALAVSLTIFSLLGAGVRWAVLPTRHQRPGID
jgi:hypothetical protein